jgi:hypothetical protein
MPLSRLTYLHIDTDEDTRLNHGLRCKLLKPTQLIRTMSVNLNLTLDDCENNKLENCYFAKTSLCLALGSRLYVGHSFDS